MDSKKKRNKKKKGNQGKNAADVTSNAGEAALQHHNHESAPIDHHKGYDADDAMSSVGEGVPQYKNHLPNLQADHNGRNAYDTTSSIGEGIACYQNNEPMVTQENHKASNAVPADQRSVGLSESSVELDMHRLYEGKLDKLHETIKQLEDEKSLWLQKVSTMEGELEKLHSKVGFHAQNEVLLEGKLNSLQSGYDVLVKKEEVLENKVRCIDNMNDILTHQEALLEERLSGLEETNKALLVQVKVLEEASNNSFEGNQMLVKKLDELDSRLQALEAKAAPSEASMIEKFPDNKVMDQVDFANSPLQQQAIGFSEFPGACTATGEFPRKASLPTSRTAARCRHPALPSVLPFRHRCFRGPIEGTVTPERTSRTWAASSTLPLNPTHQATTSEVVAMLKYRRDDYGDLARTRSEYRRVVSTPAWACPPMCFMSRGRQMQKGFGFCRLLEYS